MTATGRLRKKPYTVRLPASALEDIKRIAKNNRVIESEVARQAIAAGLLFVAGGFALQADDAPNGIGSGVGDGFLGKDRENHAAD